MMVSKPPEQPHLSAKARHALAKEMADPIIVGVPGSATAGRRLLARGPKTVADATAAGLAQKHGKGPRAPASVDPKGL